MAAGVASAQESARRAYDQAFYAPFNPQTALDMLERTPGFMLEVGGELRGFGGSAGNVLIDGARPAAKGDGVEDALARLPAASVESIELLEGADVPDARGHPVLANIRLRKTFAGSGSWSVLAERAPGGVIFPNLDLAYARNGRVWRLSGSLSGAWERHPSNGRQLRVAADGAPLKRGSEHKIGREYRLGASGSAGRALAGGELNLTGRIGWERDVDALTLSDALAPATPGWARSDRDAGDIYGLEAGGEWNGPVGERWVGKAIVVSKAEQAIGRQRGSETMPGAPPLRSSSHGRQTSGEALLHAALTSRGWARLTIEAGGEAAYNGLSSRLAYSVDEGAGPVAVDLPAANVKVHELRTEAFVNATYAIRPKLKAEAGVAIEASRLTVRGDASDSQTFSFLKPSAALAYETRGGSRLRIGVQHKVGQLSFESFAASVQTDQDRELAGNPRLQPDRTWRVYANLDRAFGDGGAVSLELFHDWRRNVLEYVVLPSGGEGVGNIESARSWGLIANATLPLDRLLNGAELKGSLELLDSRIVDPLTGRPRRLTEEVPVSYTLEFRQDLTAARAAWGLAYDSAYLIRSVYVSELMAFRQARIWRGFVETTAWAPYKLTLSLYGIGGIRSVRTRRFFDPDRAGGLEAAEDLHRRTGGYAMLTLSRTF